MLLLFLHRNGYTEGISCFILPISPLLVQGACKNRYPPLSLTSSVKKIVSHNAFTLQVECKMQCQSGFY